MAVIIETPRLLLREWEEADRAPFAALNADPEVMRYFHATIGRAESDASVDRQIARQAGDGFCLWAVERKSDRTFLGFTGLATINFDAPFPDPVETGWRLARHAWGQGYATEAARACRDWGFTTLALPGIVAFTPMPNLPSAAVMTRIGMTRVPDGDFDHPRVPEGSPLRRMLLMRIKAGEG